MSGQALKRRNIQKLKIRSQAKHPIGRAPFGCFVWFLIIFGSVFLMPTVILAVDCPLASPININTASESELDALYGIGPAKAEDIVDYRDKNGYFLKTIDIQNVSGIGSGTYESIKLCITVGSEPSDNTDDNKINNNHSETTDDAITRRSTADDVQGNSYESVIRGPLDDNFSLSIRAPKVVYVNQTFSLDAEPKNVPDRYFKRLDYAWSFGDGEAGYKQYTQHMYKYPGTYALVLKAKYRRSEQIARHTITVLPVAFSITRNPIGDIQINNDAKYEINLTGYKVKGGKTVTLPENTILLPDGTITIPKAKLAAGYQSLVILYDEQNTVVATTLGIINQTLSPSPTTVPTPTVSGTQNSHSDFTFARDQEPTVVEENVGQKTATTSVAGGPLETPRTSIPSDLWPYLGLIGLLVIGTFGVLYKS